MSPSRATAEPPAVVPAAAAQAAASREATANTRADLSTGSTVAAVQRESAVATASSSESSAEVVEELLSENERLRLIIEDMKEEVRVFFLAAIRNLQRYAASEVLTWL